MIDAIKPVYQYAAIVEGGDDGKGAHDGDTFEATVNLGVYVYIRPSIRIRGINAPELRATGGLKARDYLRSLIPIGTRLVVKTVKPDKFGNRIDAQVFRASDALDIGQEMLDSGNAVPFMTGT